MPIRGHDYVPTRPSLSDYPADLPRFRWPRLVGTLDPSTDATIVAGKSIPVTGKGWIQFLGTFSGWKFAESPQAAPLDIEPREWLPGIPSQRLYIHTVGTGTVKIREWDEEIGAILASGRGPGQESDPTTGQDTTPATAQYVNKANEPYLVPGSAAGKKTTIISDVNNDVGFPIYVSNDGAVAAALGSGGGVPLSPGGSEDFEGVVYVASGAPSVVGGVELFSAITRAS